MGRRPNRVRLSDDEHQTVKDVRDEVYGDDRVPMGVVIKRACEDFQNNR